MTSNHAPVPLDRDRISQIMHGRLALQNPVSPAKLDALVDLVALEPADRLLDVGCGRGELLVRLSERTGAGGVGVDVSPVAIEDARVRARERVPDAPLELVCGDARRVLPEGPFGLAACVGSSHALGGLPATLAALAVRVRPGGWMLVGEGFWRIEPSSGYLRALGGATRDELPDLAGLLAAGAPHGLRPVGLRVASDDDWDAYEWTLIANGDSYATEHPDQPGVDELRAWVQEARERCSRPDGRATLGFALVLLRRD